MTQIPTRIEEVHGAAAHILPSTTDEGRPIAYGFPAVQRIEVIGADDATAVFTLDPGALLLPQDLAHGEATTLKLFVGRVGTYDDWDAAWRVRRGE